MASSPIKIKDYINPLQSIRKEIKDSRIINERNKDFILNVNYKSERERVVNIKYKYSKVIYLTELSMRWIQRLCIVKKKKKKK